MYRNEHFLTYKCRSRFWP